MSLVSTPTIYEPEQISLFPHVKKIHNLNSKEIYQVIRDYDVVINCTALSSIELCEQKQSEANYLNTLLPQAFSSACERNGSKFIHFSTDAVYGDIDRPRTEESVCTPKSFYGISKLKGEELVLEANPSTLICRTNFFGYSPKQNSLLDFVIKSGLSKATLQGFSDVFFNTLYVKDLVNMVFRLLHSDAQGVFNLMGLETVSKLEFARAVFNHFGYDSDFIQEARASEISDFAKVRNLDLSVDISKLINTVGKPTPLKESIEWAARDLPSYYTIIG